MRLKPDKTRENFIDVAMDEKKREKRLQVLRKKLKSDRILVLVAGALVAATLIHDVIKNEPLSSMFLCTLVIGAWSTIFYNKTLSDIKLLLTISALQDWFVDQLIYDRFFRRFRRQTKNRVLDSAA